VPKFVDRMAGLTARGEGRPEGGEGAGLGGLSPAVSRLGNYTAREPKQPDDRGQSAESAALQEDAVGATTDYAALGEHVASVLNAARAAATKIREEARDEGRGLVERARREAADTVDAARREARKVSAEVKQLQAEAEKESRQTTQRADAYLAEKKQEADTEAAAIVTRAKREAQEHTRGAQERRSALDKNLALTEERLRQLVGALRDLAGRLDDLVGAEPAAEVPGAAEAAPASASLEESLRPSAAAQRRTPADTGK
jgi:F0F1-type ATP synthase membrane subunit b/b'